MDLTKFSNIYLVGIGGIGMSGLARYFNTKGHNVAGYDKTETALTKMLVDEGIAISYEDLDEKIPSDFKNPVDTLIIYTPAIPANSAILNYFKDNDFILNKRSQVLGMISKNVFTIAVAGTHGKTTTSSMIAHILKHSGHDCSAFLGGIATNYNSNVLFGNTDTVVVEADEYDRSFLTLHPNISVITSMDADHLDIYGDKSHLEESFKLFAAQLKTDGSLIFHKGLNLIGGMTYAVNERADIYADNVRIIDANYHFDFHSKEVEIKDIKLTLPGMHNVENVVAAIQVACLLSIDHEKIKAAVANYAGVKRRFEYIAKTGSQVYIDDYAHHPEELRACISTVKELYPEKKLTTIFQPHLFTRTRDFAKEFSEVLSLSDEVLLLDIYPARELPIEGITSEIILKNITSIRKGIYGKKEVLEQVKAQKPELILTVGAGDIDTLVKPLKQIIENA